MIPERFAGRIDPAYAAWVEASNPPLPEGYEPTLEEMRQGFLAQAAISNGERDPALAVSDHRIESPAGHDIPVRLYRHRAGQDALPTVVFVHGGGWVLGNLDSHDGVCNDIAINTSANVLAIDYRLAPEHAFPAPMADVLAVLDALDRHVLDEATDGCIDAQRLVLFGDSAGASLATAALMTRHRNERPPVAGLVLVYPGLGADIDRPSFVELRDFPGMSAELMTFFFTSYIGGEILPDEMAAPLTVEDKSGLPPTRISVAELDPLRNDGEDMAAALEAADIPVILSTEAGLGHGYLWVRRVSPVAEAAFASLCDFVAERLGTRTDQAQSSGG